MEKISSFSSIISNTLYKYPLTIDSDESSTDNSTLITKLEFSTKYLFQKIAQFSNDFHAQIILINDICRPHTADIGVHKDLSILFDFLKAFTAYNNQFIPLSNYLSFDNEIDIEETRRLSMNIISDLLNYLQLPDYISNFSSTLDIDDRGNIKVWMKQLLEIRCRCLPYHPQFLFKVGKMQASLENNERLIKCRLLSTDCSFDWWCKTLVQKNIVSCALVPAITKTYLTLSSFLASSPLESYPPDYFILFDSILMIAEQTCSDIISTSDTDTYKLVSFYLSCIGSLNSLILFSPVTPNTMTHSNIVHRLCDMCTKLITSDFDGPEVTLELVLTSLSFVMRCAPSSLDSWQLSVWNLIILLQTKFGADLVSALLSTVYICSIVKPESIHAGILILYDLGNCLKQLDDSELFLSFIDFLLAGETDKCLLRLVSSSAPSSLAASFIWQCIGLLGEIYQAIQYPVLEQFVDTYILLRCSESENQTWVGSLLSELSDQIYEVFTTPLNSELLLTASFTGLLVRLFAQRACCLPLSATFRGALLESVVCPSLQTASSICSPPQLQLALELSTSFITLLGGQCEPGEIRELTNGLPALDRVLSCVHSHHTPEWVSCISDLLAAFVNCLTSPDPSLCNSAVKIPGSGTANAKRSLLESVTNIFLRFVRQCVEFEPIQTDAGQILLQDNAAQINITAWYSLWQFLAARRIGATPSAGLAPHSHRFGLLAPLSPQNLGSIAQHQLNRIISSPPLSFSASSPLRLASLLSVLLELVSEVDWEVHSNHRPTGIVECAAFIQRHSSPQGLFQTLLSACLQSEYRNAPLSADQPTIGRSKPTNKQLRLFYQFLQCLLQILRGLDASELVDWFPLINRFIVELNEILQLPAEHPNRQFVQKDFKLQNALSHIASSGLELLRKFKHSGDAAISDSFISLLRCLWSGDSPFSQVTALQAKDLFHLVLTSKGALQEGLLQLLIEWVKSSNVLEPSQHISWPHSGPQPWPFHSKPSRQGMAALTPKLPVFRLFAFAKSSISTEHWSNADWSKSSNDADRLTSMLWPSLQKNPNGVAFSTWISLRNDSCSSQDVLFEPDLLSETRLQRYAAIGNIIHLFTLEECPFDTTSAGRHTSFPCSISSSHSLWSIQVWFVPHSAGVYVRVKKRSIEAQRTTSSTRTSVRHCYTGPGGEIPVQLSGEVHLSNVILNCGWNHLLVSLLWDNENDNAFSGKVSATVNGIRHVEASIQLQQIHGCLSDSANGSAMGIRSRLQQTLLHPQRCEEQRHISPLSSVLTLWTGHSTVVFETDGRIKLKAATVSLGSVLVFAGTFLSSEIPLQLVECLKDSVSDRLRLLALRVALLGPDWTGALPYFRADRFEVVERGHCLLRALIEQQSDELDGVSLLFAARRILGISTTYGRQECRNSSCVWLEPMRQLVKNTLLVVWSASMPNKLVWNRNYDRAGSPDKLKNNQPQKFFDGSISQRVQTISNVILNANKTIGHTEQFGSADESSHLSTVVRISDSVTYVDVELDERVMSGRKRNIDLALTPLGGIHIAFYLLGSVVCARKKHETVVCQAFDLLLSLLRHSASASAQFNRPLAVNSTSLKRTPFFRIEDTLDSIACFGLRLLSSLLSLVASRQTRIPFRLPQLFLEYIFLTVPTKMDCRQKTYLLLHPRLLSSLLLFFPNALIELTTTVDNHPSTTLILWFNSITLCLPNELTKSTCLDLISATNSHIINEFHLIECAVTSFRLHFSGQTGAQNTVLFEETLSALFSLLNVQFDRCATSGALIGFLLRTLVSVDPDLYHSAATRAFDSKPQMIPFSDTGKQKSEHFSGLPALTRSLCSILLSSITSTGQRSSTPCRPPETALNSNPSTLLRFASIPTIFIGGDSLDSDIEVEVSSSATYNTTKEILPQPDGETFEPSTSTQTVIPWIKLEPSLTLEGASKAEVRTFAKFHADLNKAASPSPRIAVGLGRSHHHHHYLHQSSESLVGECGLSSYRSLISLYHGGDDYDIDDEISMHGWSSLPDLSREEVVMFTNLARSFSGNSGLFETNSSIDRFFSLSLSSDNEAIFVNSLVETGNRPSKESNINLRLNQSRRLATVLVCCLERLWCNVDANRSPRNRLPPRWLIFHLAGHPCVCFRHSAFKLYQVFVKSSEKKRFKIFRADGNQLYFNFQLSQQFLTHSACVSLHQDCSQPSTDRNSILTGSIADHLFRPCLHSSEQCPYLAYCETGSPLPNIQHICMSSLDFLNDVCCKLQVKSHSRMVDDQEMTVLLSVIAAATVDALVITWSSRKRYYDYYLKDEARRRQRACVESIEKFVAVTKEHQNLLILLTFPRLTRICVDMIFLLQDVCDCCEQGSVEITGLQEASCNLGRLLASIVSSSEGDVSAWLQCRFSDFQDLIQLMHTGTPVFDSSKPASHIWSGVRETLMRIYISFISGIFTKIAADSSHSNLLASKTRTVLTTQLTWTSNMAVDTLLFECAPSFVKSPQSPLAKDPQTESCSRVPVIKILHKTLITLFVNAASNAMRTGADDVLLVLSCCLLRLLHTWSAVFVENYSMSEAGHWLFLLLSEEPHLIDQETHATYPEISSVVRHNLQILDAILSVPASFDLHDGQDFASSEDEKEELERKKSVYVEASRAVSALEEWFSKLASDNASLSTSHPLTRMVSTATSRQLAFMDLDDFSVVEKSHYPPDAPLQHPLVLPSSSSSNPVVAEMEHFDWLPRLRLCKEQGQQQWSAFLSQKRYLLTVLAPFQWTRLTETLSHDKSVFHDESRKAIFSYVDAFESESRQRCRRRPAIIWLDERFVRPDSKLRLGQHIASHPLHDLLLPLPSYTFGGRLDRCQIYPHARFPPSCLSLFEPSSVVASERCLGVWPCRLIDISAPSPLNGDLVLDESWLHLLLNTVHEDSKLEGDSTAIPSNGPLMHGLDENEVGQNEVLTCPLRAIARVEERRFELRDLAAEIFFHISFAVPPLLIALRSNQERDNFLHFLAEACGHLSSPSGTVSWWERGGSVKPTAAATLRQANVGIRGKPARFPRLSLRRLCDTLVTPFPTPVGAAMRQRLINSQVAWLQGRMSNFDYLMVINTVAGRSFNDLTQYPIFPWVISDFESEVLDLTKPSSFRRLDRPISVQSDTRAEIVSTRYQELKQHQVDALAGGGSVDEDQINIMCPIFHYPSYCSNEAIILHFLFRLNPYSFRLIQFQDGNFDAPDRLFHTVANEWAMATSSISCVKELVPEFFFRPDIFTNWDNFNLGERHNSTSVNAVLLPPWAKGDPRLFTLVNRAALESTYVTAHLPAWIDLMFGYKQTGRQGEKAINLYHPFTYFGAIDVDAIEDPMRRSAVHSMIRNYGQAPRQLFPKHPHPRRTLANVDHLRRSDFGDTSDYFGLMWLIRLFLSLPISVSSSPPSSPNLPRLDDPSIALVHAPTETPSAAGSPLGAGSPVASGSKSILIPLTAGTPLDTVRGLSWGTWAGGPDSPPLTVQWLAHLRDSAVGPSRQSYCHVGYQMQAIYWTGPVVVALTPGHQGRVIINTTSSSNSSSSRAYWSLLVSPFGVFTGVVRAGISNLSPILFQFRVLLESRRCGLEPMSVRVTARRFLASDHAGSQQKKEQNRGVCVPLPGAVVDLTTSFHVCGDLERPIERSSELRILVGSRDGGLFIYTLTAEDLSQSILMDDEVESVEKMPKMSKLSSIDESSSGSASDLDSSYSDDDGSYSMQRSYKPNHQHNSSHHFRESMRSGRLQHSSTSAPRCLSIKDSSTSSSFSSRNGWQCMVGHIGSPVVCLASCPSFGLIASGDACGRVVVWDLVSASFLCELDTSSCDQQDHFMEVCGLQFNRLTGDLLVAKCASSNRKELWCGLYTADCRQSCSRVLEFLAEMGFLANGAVSLGTKPPSRAATAQPSAANTSHELDHFRVPILFSRSTDGGAKVDCILVGGVEGCLVWLNSWTLDTVSTLRLDQPSPCPIVSLLFSPPASLSNHHPSAVHYLSTSDYHPDVAPSFCQSLYVVDSLGWLYFLESKQTEKHNSSEFHPPRLKPVLELPQASGCNFKPNLSLHLPGLWL